MNYSLYDYYGKEPKPLDYPEGSILVDVRYVESPESFEVIYWDPVLKELQVKYEDPIIDIWFLKEEYRTNFNELDNGEKEYYQISQAEMDKSFIVYTKPSRISQTISKFAGDIKIPPDMGMNITYSEYYAYAKENNIDKFTLRKTMCRNPLVFKADFTFDVYFRLRWLHQYGDDVDVSKATYAFIDIETDVIDRVVDLQDYSSYGQQPVNAITVILPFKKICAVLLLAPRPKSRIHEKFHKLLDMQIPEYEWIYNHQEEFKRMIREDDEDNKVYLKDYDIRLHFFDFNNEINMIKTAYDYINKYKPMFTYAWNGPFDFNYMPSRIEYLGYNKLDIICPDDFKTKMYRFQQDKQKNFQMKTSKDWFFASSFTTFICQMRLFAAIRKSKAERRSYSLSSVGKDIAKIDKLSQTKSGTFREFAYTDYIKFILYNVRDVVVQVAIEHFANDSQSLLARSYQFATQFSKCFQETHIVRNSREYDFEIDGYVQACRLDIDKSIDPAFKGAFVAEPKLNDFTGFILNGSYCNNIMFGVFDADASSYYPSSKMGMNMDPMTLIFKAIIINDVFISHQCFNKSFNQSYTWYDSSNKPHAEDLTGPIINSYKNKNICGVLYNWFNVPSITDIFNYVNMNL